MTHRVMANIDGQGISPHFCFTLALGLAASAYFLSQDKIRDIYSIRSANQAHAFALLAQAASDLSPTSLSAAPTHPPIPPAVAQIREVLERKLPSFKESNYEKLALHIYSLCVKYNFSPVFILGLIHVESDFQPRIESVAGAVGLMQVLPSTAQEVAKELALPWKGKKTLMDPMLNVQIGFHYLHQLRTRFSKSREYVTAYNWGPGKVGELLQSRRRLPLDYFRKIERAKQEYAHVNSVIGL